MSDLTIKIPKPLGDCEVEKEPEVTQNLPSAANNIKISISPIEGLHKIVKLIPIKLLLLVRVLFWLMRIRIS